MWCLFFQALPRKLYRSDAAQQTSLDPEERGALPEDRPQQPTPDKETWRHHSPSMVQESHVPGAPQDKHDSKLGTLQLHIWLYMSLYVCTIVCLHAKARASSRCCVRVCGCVRVCMWMSGFCIFVCRLMKPSCKTVCPAIVHPHLPHNLFDMISTVLSGRPC